MKRLITAGVDEVGRGCLAGPVVSAAVVLKKGVNLKLLKDSKKITFNKREKISKHIKENSYFAIGIASVEEILKLNIFQASLLSMKRALNQLTIKPDITFVLKVKKQSFLSRLKNRRSRNRYDNFPVKFYIKAQNAFLKLSKNKKDHIILESSKNTPELQKKIFEIIKKKIGLKC